MATTIYRSTDASAPVLTGSVGSLVTLLDACLVNGYGAKPAAGWSKAFSGTNAASYRQGSGGFYWDVNDNAPGAAAAREARTRGYETMTAVATGTGLFPTVAQSNPGVIVRKSTTADATVRDWVVAADDRTVYLFLLTGDSAGIYLGTGFGDFVSVMFGDTYKCALSGRITENAASAASTGELFGQLGVVGFNIGYIARAHTGIGTAITFNKGGDLALGTSPSSLYGWVGTMAYPNPADSGLYMSRIRLITGAAASAGVRGWMRGLYQPTHPVGTFADGDTFDGVGDYAGRSFLCLARSGSANQGTYVIETTAWDTSL